MSKPTFLFANHGCSCECDFCSGSTEIPGGSCDKCWLHGAEWDEANGPNPEEVPPIGAWQGRNW